MKKVILIFALLMFSLFVTSCLQSNSLNKSLNNGNNIDCETTNQISSTDNKYLVNDVETEINKFNASEITEKLSADLDIEDVLPLLGIDREDATIGSSTKGCVFNGISLYISCGDSFVAIFANGSSRNYKGITWKVYNNIPRSSSFFDEYAEKLDSKTLEYDIDFEKAAEIFGMPVFAGYSGIRAMDYISAEGEKYTLMFTALGIEPTYERLYHIKK